MDIYHHDTKTPTIYIRHGCRRDGFLPSDAFIRRFVSTHTLYTWGDELILQNRYIEMIVHARYHPKPRAQLLPKARARRFTSRVFVYKHTSSWCTSENLMAVILDMVELGDMLAEKWWLMWHIRPTWRLHHKVLSCLQEQTNIHVKKVNQIKCD